MSEALDFGDFAMRMMHNREPERDAPAPDSLNSQVAWVEYLALNRGGLSE